MFQACSGFVKAFQNTGGAIIVGFNGNPKIEGTNEFDGSQASSSVMAFTSEEYYNLQDLGYSISGITYAESYDDSYQLQNENKAPIPREYTVDLVDRRVPIYSGYSDDIYDKFIKEADKIFKEFETKCNKNNKLLLLDDESCTLKEHEKGGHPCNDNGEWDKSKCEAYYCDLGYYYDQFQKKCTLDPCTNIKNEKNIIINDTTYHKTTELTIEPDTEMSIFLNNDNYMYFIESDTDNLITTNYKSQGLENSTRLCIVDYQHTNIFDYEVTLNYYRILNKQAKVKITTVDKNPSIITGYNLHQDTLSHSAYMNIEGEYQILNTLQFSKKTVIFTHSFNKGINVYYHEYNFDITPKEIMEINNNKFKEISNKIFNMEENKTYLFIIKYPKDFTSSSYLFIDPYDMQQNIPISNKRFLYLTNQNLYYNLFFANNYKSVYIKLCEQTPDAEITILGDKNTTLNKNNKFYLVQNIKEELSLKLNNNNPALIEFFYEYSTIKLTNLDTKKTKFDLNNNNVYILKYKKSDNINTIKLYLESKEALDFILSSNYGKGNCIGAIPDEIKLKEKNYTTEYLVPIEQLTDDETFDILLALNHNSTLSITLNGKENNENESEGFPTWAIIVIAVVGALIIGAIIFVIVLRAKRDNVDADSIEKGKLLNSFD